MAAIRPRRRGCALWWSVRPRERRGMGPILPSGRCRATRGGGTTSINPPVRPATSISRRWVRTARREARVRTPTSPSPGDAGGTAGFTLIEVVAVLAVLALAIGTVMLSLARRTDRANVAALAADTASLARAARDRAVRTGREAVLSVDLNSRTIVASGGRRT